jgi:hypothetical protein
MEMWRSMIIIKHADNDTEETTDLWHFNLQRYYTGFLGNFINKPGSVIGVILLAAGADIFQVTSKSMNSIFTRRY